MILWYLPLALSLAAIVLLVGLRRPLGLTMSQFALAELVPAVVGVLSTLVLIGRSPLEAIALTWLVVCFGLAALTATLLDIQSPARVVRDAPPSVASVAPLILELEVSPTRSQTGDGMRREDGFSVPKDGPFRAWRAARRRLLIPGLMAIAGMPVAFLFSQQLGALTAGLLVLSSAGVALLLAQRSLPVAGVVSLDAEPAIIHEVDAWAPRFVVSDAFSPIAYYASEEAAWVLMSPKTSGLTGALLVTDSMMVQGDGPAMTRKEWLLILAFGRAGLSRRLKLALVQ